MAGLMRGDGIGRGDYQGVMSDALGQRASSTYHGGVLMTGSPSLENNVRKESNC
jgi:hypothetical protein